ncbi:MAG: multiheme c-type cytochrome, partial [Myxococcota bacterium]
MPAPRLVVDSGASLDKPGRKGPGSSLDQRRIKAALVAEAFALGGIDAMALSASDWALGADFVRELIAEHELPVLAANLTCDEVSAYPPSRRVMLGGHAIGIVATTDGEVPGCTVGPAAPAIRAASAALSDVDFTVALVPATDTREVGRVIAEEGGDLGVDLVIDANSRSLQARPQQRAGTWWMSAGGRGRHLGVATLTFAESEDWTVAVGTLGDPAADRARTQERRDEAARLAADAATDELRARYRAQVDAYDRKLASLPTAASRTSNHIGLEVVALDRDVADHPATAELVGKAKTTISNTVSTAPTSFVSRRVPSGPYAGGEACVACHTGPHAQWSRTGHARAWQGLVSVNRAFDDACWSCHVTGAHRRGGPSAPKGTGPYRDVQCEACHGPSRAHAERPDDAS